MNVKTIKLVKGDLIGTKGKNYRVTSIAKVQVAPDKQKGPIVGEHQSDVDPQRFKRIACQIIEDRIKALEQEESNALCTINEDDSLFLFDGAEYVPKTSFSEQISRTTSIVDLRQILKQIKAI